MSTESNSQTENLFVENLPTEGRQRLERVFLRSLVFLSQPPHLQALLAQKAPTVAQYWKDQQPGFPITKQDIQDALLKDGVHPTSVNTVTILLRKAGILKK